MTEQVTQEVMSVSNEQAKFNLFFEHKGQIGPICEKACRNVKIIKDLEEKTNTSTTLQKEKTKERLFYFALGHKYKTIDTKHLFDFVYDEATKNEVPQRFKSLQKEAIDFCDFLYKYEGNQEKKQFDESGLLNDIRNINSHYIHDFSRLNVDATTFFTYISKKRLKVISSKDNFKTFIEEAFLLSCIVNYCEENKENKVTQENFWAEGHQNKITRYLQQKFFPSKKKEIEQLEKEIKNYPVISEVYERKHKRLIGLKKHQTFVDTFITFSYQEAIEELLYIKVANDFDYVIENTPAFKIHKGTYLSYYACLFIVSLLLYKDEATRLISKIKGFKKNKEEDKKKLELFTFFSKKYSSQDIDHNEKHLIKFRDIIQYLNKYPTAWNNEIKFASLNPEENLKNAITHNEETSRSLENKTGLLFPEMTNSLVEFIFRKEIKKTYLTKTDNKFNNNSIDTFKKEVLKNHLEDFIVYCKNLFIKENKKVRYLDGNLRQEFEDKLFIPKEIQDAKIKIEELTEQIKRNPKNKDKYEWQINRNQKTINEFENSENKISKETEKLRRRIAQNTLLLSYGRNQDKFMEYAMHFLASHHYFGNDALFKCYLAQTVEENERIKDDKRKKLSKKEFDKLKYHNGRLVDFVSYENVKAWDSPFVEENNAISIKIKVENQELLIPISRNIIIYLLENALYDYDIQKNVTLDIANRGLKLMANYYKRYKETLTTKITTIKNGGITTESKKEYTQLFPKRLLQNILGEQRKIDKEALKKCFDDALLQEKRYEKLKSIAEKNNVLADFEKKNKGKQFKLRFMKKAWNLMYFKETYKESVALHPTKEHHKAFHITLEEFNDFSRFLFAFDLPHYKENLRQLLDKKGFFANVDFLHLFDNNLTFDSLYEKTKVNYSEWLKNSTPYKANAFTVENYKFIQNIESLHTVSETKKSFLLAINVSDFIDFLKNENYLKVENNKIIYTLLRNKKDLQEEAWYSKNENDKKKRKQHRYLFNQLQQTRLEDCYLYEIALYYGKVKNKDKIAEIQQQVCTIPINDKAGISQYHITVPFKHLEAFERNIIFKQKQEQYYGGAFMIGLKKFLITLNGEYKEYKSNNKSYDNSNDIYKAIVSIIQKFPNDQATPTITYDDFKKVEGYLLTSSNQFSKVLMAMEGYFCTKQENSTSILKQNAYSITNNEAFHIKFEKFEKLFKEDYDIEKGKKSLRNKAFHFAIPDISYKLKLGEMEKTFIQNEIIANPSIDLSEISSFNDFGNRRLAEVLTAFKSVLHNDLYATAEKSLSNEEKKDSYLVRKTEEKLYIDEVINMVQVI